VTRVEDVRPVGRGEGGWLSRVQYERFADVLDSLRAEEWALPTDCPGWDVKAVASHVLGGLECVRRPREFVRQYRAGMRVAKQRGIDPLDGMNAVQVREHATMPASDVALKIRTLTGPALAHRARTPLLLRQGVRPKLHVIGRVPLAWVLDTVYTRDTFVHRIDVCRATGREVVLDDIEKRVVADVVREWAGLHGKPVTLRLAGPAGDEYVAGGGGEVIECDAVEFTRLVSGRGSAPEGLLAVAAQF
jgi:uncharacterized protein (TIGR03083 family)